MKKIALICGLIAFIACNQMKEPEVNYALFSGKITNSDAETFFVFNESFKKEISINEDGSFSDTLFIEENGYYTLRIDRESTGLHLEKGNQLAMTIDTKEFDETVTYTGVGAEASNLLAKRYLLNEELTVSTRDLYSKEEDEFLAEVKMVRTKNEELINQSKAKDVVKNQQLEDAKYAFALALSNYEKYHGYFTGNQEFEASEEFLSNQIEFDINDEAVFAHSDNYKSLVMGTIEARVGEKVNDESDYTPAVIEVVSAIEEGAIKNEVLDYYASVLLSPGGDLKTGFDFLMANTGDEESKKAYQERYDVLKKLAKGMPSPTFTDYENHSGGTTSLEDLKGKYAYIDVWATWCGPCKREIPFLKEIEQEFHGKNIQFVSTSIDRAKDHGVWVNMVKDEELGGMQLMADNDWNSTFVKDYGINGIPRFILIDPEGNIVDADAPRPSDPDLKSLFEELNI